MVEPDNKKKTEAHVLEAARVAGFIVPSGEVIPGEEPDYRIKNETGTILGIELTEVMPPPRDKSFSSPVAEMKLHESVIEIAEQEYYQTVDAVPVQVSVYFWRIERTRSKKQEIAHALVDFVRAHCNEANPVAIFTRLRKIPDGFGTVIIRSTPRPWWSGESSSNMLEDIQEQIAASIAGKNKLLATYRANLPNTPIWLLLYSCAGVSRGIEMWPVVDEWSFAFDFDRVFFFATLNGSIVEIQRAVA
jgi:hypothetical protein